MSELRLAPAALAVWAVALAVGFSPALGVVVLVLAAGASYFVDRSQPLLVAILGAGSLVLATLRRAAVEALLAGTELIGRAGQARKSPAGWVLDVHAGRARVPVFVSEDPGDITGALVHAEGRGREGLFLAKELGVLKPPGVLTSWASGVRGHFAEVVSAQVGSPAAGLVPGMVVGDTSLQSPEEKASYIAAGLAHLSAVSGGNVAIVTTSVAVLASAVGAPPWAKGAASLVALAGYVVLVGIEPSVARAAIMGVVGLVALLAAGYAPPLHALSIAVILLVYLDSSMAANYGFALSVAATAGIVALSPFIHRSIADSTPKLLAKALSIAIAAEILTIPIVAFMAGYVSVVSVVANVLAAPLVAPITLLGLVAVILSQLPGGLEFLPLVFAEPLAWLVGQIGLGAARVPGAVIELPNPTWALLLSCWVLALAKVKKLRYVAVAAVLSIAWNVRLPPAEVDYTALRVVSVRSAEEAEGVQADLILVSDPQGAPARYPTVRRDGVPVMFPARNGPVRLYADGTQHAADGRF